MTINFADYLENKSYEQALQIWKKQSLYLVRLYKVEEEKIGFYLPSVLYKIYIGQAVFLLVRQSAG